MSLGKSIWIWFIAHCLIQPTVFSQNLNPSPDWAKLQLDQDTLLHGLIHQHFSSDSNTFAFPIQIHVLKVPLDSIRLELGLALDQVIGQETVEDMVIRKGALAGINGGFSFSNNPWNLYHGDPKDFMMVDGQVISEPFSTRSSFGWVEQNGVQIPILAEIAWQMIAIIRNDTMPIHGINRKPHSLENIYYTPHFNRTTLTPNGTLELVFDEKHQIVLVNQAGSSVIPEHGGVLAIGNSLPYQSIEPGNTISFHQTIRQHKALNQGYDITKAFFHTAGPTLMIEGVPVYRQAAEQIHEAFFTTKHPRTGIGISQDRKTLWLCTVDGRQPTISDGFTLAELTSFLKYLGAHHAYNLDGGGSTTMVIDATIVNQPSDHQPRRRCDALLLFSK